MLILAWYKLADDAQDEGRAYAKAGTAASRRIWRKLVGKHPSLCRSIGDHLRALSQLEETNCDSIDRTADHFATIMAEIFTAALDWLYGDTDTILSPQLHENFAKAGYHLGKWIYLIDAADDIEENLESGVYNPLFPRYSYRAGEEGPDEFRQRIDESLRFNLFQYLAGLAESVESLDIQKNSGIIENVVYFGLNRRTEEVLTRTSPERRRSYRL